MKNIAVITGRVNAKRVNHTVKTAPGQAGLA
jgi:hypothetical protein